MKTGWKILFAHKDEELHHIFKMGLNGHSYLGRNFDVHSVHSINSASEYLSQQKDLALFIIDAGMAFGSGSQVLQDLIKGTIQDTPPRIVVITDSSSKRADWAMLDFCLVDSVLPKEDLFSSLLFSCIRTAVKAYNDLKSCVRNNTTLGNDEINLSSDSNFVASLGDDLKTPLNTILSVIDFIIGTDLTDDQYDLVKVLSIESNTLNNLINQILDYSRLVGKSLLIENSPFNLNELLEEVTDSLSLEAYQKGLEFNLLVNNNVPTALTGDPRRLKQILVNLAKNALKFTSEGEILIKVEFIKEAESKTELLFAVMDTGLGIQHEKQNSVFEKYVDGRRESSHLDGGSGLGTAIAKKLCELMDGEIGVISKTELGTIFWFRVPFLKRSSFESWVNPHQLPEGLNLLILSNHPTSRNIFSEYLNDRGCSIIFANSSQELLTTIHDTPLTFDLIIVDTCISESNAFDASQAIRTDVAGKKIPIVVLVSKGRKGDGDRCKKIGIDAYLQKPFTYDRLLGVLSKLFVQEGHNAWADLDYEGDKEKTLVTRRSVIEKGNNKKRVLLVEKNSAVRSVLKRHICSSGFTVDETGCGLEALKFFKLNEYSLLFLDLQVQKPEWIEIVQAIRSFEKMSFSENGDKPNSPQEKKVSIVGMTSYASKDFYRTCLDAGMDDVLIKPLSRSELLRITERWFETANNQSVTQRENPLTETDMQSTYTYAGPEEDDPIDYRNMLTRFKGKKHFLDDTIITFLNKGRESIEHVRGAFLEGKIEDLANGAYYLRGGATNIKAKKLLKALIPVEDAIRTGDGEAFNPALEALEEEFSLIEQFVRVKGIGDS